MLFKLDFITQKVRKFLHNFHAYVTFCERFSFVLWVHTGTFLLTNSSIQIQSQITKFD